MFLYKKGFYLQGIFIYINERDTSSLDCKHNQMVQKTEPDKFGTLYRVLHIEFHGFNSRIDISGLSHVGSWY